jgi:hypothetical protein
MALGVLSMTDINYKEMEFWALRDYIVEHREDEEALRELMSRNRDKAEVYPMPTEENMEWLTEVIKSKAAQGRKKG